MFMNQGAPAVTGFAFVAAADKGHDENIITICFLRVVAAMCYHFEILVLVVSAGTHSGTLFRTQNRGLATNLLILECLLRSNLSKRSKQH